MNKVNKGALQGDGHFVQLAPHIRSNDSVQKIMRDVIIALMPAVIGSIYFFKLNALWIYLVSIIFCVGSEYIYQKLAKKPIQVSDLSAVVTGILLAMNMPSGVPLYVVAIGAIFAIVIVKECFGGIGGNFVNPALAARAMCMSSWPSAMSTYLNPDGIAAATPLGIIKEGGNLEALPAISDMAIGNIGGVIGETSAILLAIGAIYLIVRKVIDWKTPVIYILSVAIFCVVFGIPASLLPYEILGGGLVLGACFMATDYSSTPNSKKGKIIFAIGCGLITAVIRAHGSMAEGVSYSILLMNVATPLIERFTKTEAYGEAK